MLSDRGVRLGYLRRAGDRPHAIGGRADRVGRRARDWRRDVRGCSPHRVRHSLSRPGRHRRDRRTAAAVVGMGAGIAAGPVEHWRRARTAARRVYANRRRWRGQLAAGCRDGGRARLHDRRHGAAACGRRGIAARRGGNAPGASDRSVCRAEGRDDV